jgi:hypothetical protein
MIAREFKVSEVKAEIMIKGKNSTIHQSFKKLFFK